MQGADFDGTVSGEGEVWVEAEVALTPTYKECTGFGVPLEVDTNSCAYVIVPDVIEGSNYEAKARVECEEAGDSITFIAKVLGVTKCTVHIGEQGGLKNVTIEDEGSPSEIHADIELTGIKYSQTAGTGLGACTKAENTTNGTYNGTATIAGTVGESSVSLQAKPLPQTINVKPNPMVFDGKVGTKVNVELINLTAQEVKIIGGALPDPAGSIKPEVKCKKLAKQGDPGSTCKENWECAKLTGVENLSVGLYTSPPGGALFTIQKC
jgi:hypothetical protein